MRVFVAVVALTLLFQITGSTAHAQQVSPRDRRSAKRAYVKGVEHLKAGEAASALPFFEKANALDPNPILVWNIGRCHEEMGGLALAIAWFERYLALEIQPADREDAQAKIQSLKGRLPATLVLIGIPIEAILHLDDEVRPRGERRFDLAPGTHRLRVEAPEHRDFVRTVDLEPGSTREIEVKLLALEGPPPPPRAGEVRETGSSARTTRRWANGLFIAGAAVAGGGLIASLLANQNRDEVRTAMKDTEPITAMTMARAATLDSDARTIDNVALGLYVGGGAILLTSLVLWFVAPDEPVAKALRLEGGALPGGAWVGVGGGF